MNIEQKVTSLELSKQLKEAGFPQEGLFAWYETPREKTMSCLRTPYLVLINDTDTDGFNYYKEFVVAIAPLPCELGEVLPSDAYDESVLLWKIGNIYYCSCQGDETIPTFESDKLADAMSKMYLYLKKEGLIK